MTPTSDGGDWSRRRAGNYLECVMRNALDVH